MISNNTHKYANVANVRLDVRRMGGTVIVKAASPKMGPAFVEQSIVFSEEPKEGDVLKLIHSTSLNYTRYNRGPTMEAADFDMGTL